MNDDIELRARSALVAEPNGHEASSASASAVSARNPGSLRSEIALTIAAFVFTSIAGIFLTVEYAGTLRGFASRGDIAGVLGQVLFIAIVALLTWGSIVYQLTRVAYYRRRLAHKPAPATVLERSFEDAAPSLTVLVPSYREEAHLVRRTLLSAALQDYPNRRVVLLIDDPANPTHDADARALRDMNSMLAQLHGQFAGMAAAFARECATFESRCAGGALEPSEEAGRISRLYEDAAKWLEEQAAQLAGATPGDALLRDEVLLVLAARHRTRARLMALRAQSGGGAQQQLQYEYRRLASLFRVEFASFQRKRYVNLAHEPNKAMNLNAFIGLMGGHFREVQRSDGLHLEPCAADAASWSAPDADYLITLDADSVIVPCYALRLIDYMRAPGNERVAVAQTPYSTIPAPAGTLEHIAGATTDIQYNIHQGFTAFDSTYWVGANALLRKRALEDIAEVGYERGFAVTRFIQDRTVIEDTESSIDLVNRGWGLYNYPERLAYSATPADFGALLIQRRRWANGGLIILPKLLRYLVRGPSRARKAMEGFFRCHYLVSIAAVNAGLLVMLAVPFEESLRSPWLPLSVLPYFLLYARDLTLIGYRYTDLLRVYALNTLLIPVNLGGVLKSLQQAVMSRKSAFVRTPKVAGRTSAPALYVLAECALLGWWLVIAASDFIAGHYAHMMFALTSTGFLAYAVHRYIGWRDGVTDVRSGFAQFMGQLNTRVPLRFGMTDRSKANAQIAEREVVAAARVQRSESRG